MQRADEVKRANRRLKAMNETLERQEAELSKANERLRELDKAKSEFLANVSHELRTPLALVLGPIESLLAGEPAGSPRFEELRMARRNALRLQRQVDAVLEFSKIEAGARRVDLRPVDLAGLTADVAGAYSSICASAGLSLTIDCPPLPGLVRIDPGMWEKIVLNLLSNAFKFTLQGAIRVTLSGVADAVELRVEDSGVGIPPEELPHVFERFHRVAGAAGRTTEGSGIGLALVYEFAHLLGGSAHVESVPDHGSVFTVCIPVDRYEAAGAESGWDRTNLAQALIGEAERWAAPSSMGDALPEEPASVATAGDDARPLVVVADDNADMRNFLLGLLQRGGYRAHAATDGAAALAACRDRSPALLLSDVMMPVVDGLELTRRLRGDAAIAALPIVLLSARAGEAARIEGLQAGADEYLEKPFGSRELLARIDSALRLAKVRAALTERIAKSEQRLRAIIDGVGEAIICIDDDGCIQSINRPGRADVRL